MTKKSTSRAAHNSVKPHKGEIYKKIVRGMKRLKNGGTFEEIARASRLQPSQVWKRLSEMVDMKIIYNTGSTRTTSSGRQAMVRKLYS